MPQDNDNEVCILLGVWGKNFINDFLQLSLPSLLAPGNIPALIKAYKTRFVFLTLKSEIEIFESILAFQKLKTICNVEFIFIEDLIGFGNYSTTLTLAYDRAIKQYKEKMLSTYFVFLTSDYIMANGSFEGLMRYMRQGYSGICAGNFQVTKEEIEPFLLEHLDRNSQTLLINPRQLLKKSFPSLHPIVFASMFEQKIVHNNHVNRFFLRHDSQTLAGRFYLLHMLCIKPETMDYQVGSSCDYSFIPELCPSGNVAVITDSDDYLVVEIQSIHHEVNFLKFGPYDLNTLAHNLGEWTTSRHRENAKHTIYYHVQDLTPADKKTIDHQLNQFVTDLDSRLQKYQMQPHRNHPYWLGAIESLQKHRQMIESGDDGEYHDLNLLNHAGFVKKVYFFLYGAAPNVRPWHHRWHEYRDVLDTIDLHVTDVDPKNILILYSFSSAEFTRYHHYLRHSKKLLHHYNLRSLRDSPGKLKELQQGQFQRCIFFVTLEDYKQIRSSLLTIRKMLKIDGQCMVLIPNQFNHISNLTYNFEADFTRKINTIIGTPYHIKDVRTVHNRLTKLGAMTLARINDLFSGKKIFKLISLLFIGLPGFAVCVANNCFQIFSKREKGHCTDIIVTLTPDKEAT